MKRAPRQEAWPAMAVARCAPWPATPVAVTVTWLVCVVTLSSQVAWLWPWFASVGVVQAPLGKRGLLADGEAYSVVVDAGSTGSRVHIFRIDRASGRLLDVHGEAEVLRTTSPGLSACAENRSLLPALLEPLLDVAATAVPEALQPVTPVTVRATAGLRLLPGEQADSILRGVRELLARYRFRIGDVEVMSGADEGTFQWLAVNALLSPGSESLCGGGGAVVLDMGGASVQVAYSVPGERPAGGRESYLRDVRLHSGCRAPLYQHSYLGYGIVAGRAKMFEESAKNGSASANPCLLAGWEGTYTYNGRTFHAAGAPDAAACRRLVAATLRLEEPCGESACSFAGAWAGPGWEPPRRHGGPSRLRRGSAGGPPTIAACGALFDGLRGVGAVPAGGQAAAATPRMYRDLAAAACAVPWAEVSATYPGRPKEVAPWVCFDLTYFAVVLELGLGLAPDRELLVARALEHEDASGRLRSFSATWPLGVALAAAAGGDGGDGA